MNVIKNHDQLLIVTMELKSPVTTNPSSFVNLVAAALFPHSYEYLAILARVSSS